MRVWIINHYSLAPDMPGGTRHFSLAKAFVQMGHDVTLVASSFHHGLYKDLRLQPGELFQHEIIDGVRFVWLRGMSYSKASSAKRLLNMLEFSWYVIRKIGLQTLPPPDIIIGGSVHLFAPVAAYWLAHRYKVPFVLEIRDIWPQTLIDVGGISPYHPLILIFQLVERFLYRVADRIITVLPQAGEYIAEKSGRSKSIVLWIPNFIDFNVIPPPQLPANQPVFTLMYAGTHGIANDLLPTLQAAGILQQQGLGHRVHVRFVGDGPLKADLQAYASINNINNVSFEDSVSKSQIYSVLAEADAFILSFKKANKLYRWGVSPNKLYDYLGMARPIIYAIDSPDKVINDSQAGIIIPAEDAQAIADAIQSLVALSVEERWQMGLRGRKYAKDHFDVTILAQKIEDMLNELISSETVR